MAVGIVHEVEERHPTATHVVAAHERVEGQPHACPPLIPRHLLINLITT